MTPSRMAPQTAICFALIASAAFLIQSQWQRAIAAGQLLAIFTAAVALFALIGYMYGVTAFYAVSAFTPMAVHSGVCVLLISGALLAARADRGIMAAISDAGFAGQSARALLPTAMIIPLLLGWLRLLGERAGLYSDEVGVALMITATVLVLVGLVVVGVVAVVVLAGIEDAAVVEAAGLPIPSMGAMKFSYRK